MARLALFLAGFALAANGLEVAQANGSEDNGSKTEITARITNLRERPNNLFCSCNNIEGRDLVFDLAIENLSGSEKTVHVFLWASNDEVNPPERGLWPVSAVETSLTESGALNVRDPAQGARFVVPGEAVVQAREKTIHQPIGWWKGKRLGFRQLRVQVWLPEGGVLLDKWFEVPEPLNEGP